MREMREQPIEGQKFLAEPTDQLRAALGGLLNPILWGVRENVRVLAANQLEENQPATGLQHPHHFSEGGWLEGFRNVLDHGNVRHAIKNRIGKREAERFPSKERSSGSLLASES